MLLLDTHVLLYRITGETRLGRLARQTVNEAWLSGEAAVSAITFWEIALLYNRGRIALPMEPDSLRDNTLGQGLMEIPVDGRIGILANALSGFHRDPADRIIVATALAGGHQLITADLEILEWAGPLSRIDAAR